MSEQVVKVVCITTNKHVRCVCVCLFEQHWESRSPLYHPPTHRSFTTDIYTLLHFSHLPPVRFPDSLFSVEQKKKDNTHTVSNMLRTKQTQTQRYRVTEA